MMDQRDPICDRLGKLAASVAPDDERAPDARAWAQIGEQLDRRASWHSPRRLVPALVLFAAIAVGTGFLLWPQRPLAYRVQGCSTTADGTFCPSQGLLAFADGTEIAVDPGARLRVTPLVHGAELSLEDGVANLAVVHRPSARWAVLAGPFKVEVTGTRFSVGWQKSRQVLDVAVREGEVRVSGGPLAQTAVLHPGQSLHTQAGPPEDNPPMAQQPASPPDSAGSTPRPVSGPSASVATVDPSTPRARMRSSRQHASPAAGASSAGTKGPASAAPQAAQANQTDRPPSTGPASAPAAARPPAPVSGPASASHGSWASASSLGVPSPEAAASARPTSNEILFGSDGYLVGAMTGRAWLARGEGTRLSSPVSDEANPGLSPQREGLCASGTVAGLTCVNLTHPRCNWDRNWGVVIGFDPRADRLAWGEDAARAIAVEFHGRSSSYRLTAHRKGDPPRKIYCVENYKSGRMVTPSMFKSRCWDGSGDVLPDFKSVDQFGLQLASTMEYIGFHYCVSGIRIDR